MNKIKDSRILSLLVMLALYGAALTAAILIYRLLPSYYSQLLKTLIADISASAVIFLFSLLFNNSSCYDAYWSVAPPLLFTFWIILSGQETLPSLSSLILTGLTFFWGIRLTVNWVRSWPGLRHEDWRFTDMRKKTGKFFWMISFLGLHIYPTLMVFFCSLPAYYVLTSRNNSFGIIDLLATAAGLTAVFLEWKSDRQLATHLKSSESGKPIRSGLWKYSRHPNYFGEVLFWFSIYFFLLAAVPDKYWIGVAPLLMLAQFLFVSIPIMEKRQLERRKGYKDIQKNVSVFIPLPPKKNYKQRFNRNQ